MKEMSNEWKMTSERLVRKTEYSAPDGRMKVDYLDETENLLERRYEMDAYGQLDGYYRVWDKEGKITFETKYEHGVEHGTRINKVLGIKDDLYEHRQVIHGNAQPSVYRDSAYATGRELEPFTTSDLIMEQRVAVLIEEFPETSLSIGSEFKVEEWENDNIEKAVETAMERCGVGDYTFSAEIKEIFESHCQNHDKISDFFEDLAYGGCSSGLVCEVVYYSDTKDFYLRHMDDIESFISDIGDDIGEPVKLQDPHYNSAVWLIVEECGYRIGNSIEEVYEEIVNDNLLSLDEWQVKEVMEHSSHEDVKAIATTCYEDNFLFEGEETESLTSGIVQEAEQKLGKSWDKPSRDDRRDDVTNKKGLKP